MLRLFGMIMVFGGAAVLFSAQRRAGRQKGEQKEDKQEQGSSRVRTVQAAGLVLLLLGAVMIVRG